MANGSFGLSGVPTAPSTVGTVPNNPLSPVTVAVNSVAGFQAGDLIYNINGDVQPIPGNYVSSATFPITESSPVSVPNVTFGEQQIPPVTRGAAYKGYNNAATLTNGNIVIVYQGGLATGNYPTFKIVSETGTVVVTDTAISTAAGFSCVYGSISVCALTGGGFAVGWTDATALYANYAVYDNAGSVVVAASHDTNLTTSGNTSWVLVTARPDGSFILAGLNGSTQVKHDIFSATGSLLFGPINAGSNQAVGDQFCYVVRADNSFVVITGNASSGLSWFTYNSSGVAVANGVVTTNNPQNATYWGGASLLTNGSIIITWGRSSGLWYAQLSSGNAITGDVAFTSLASNGQNCSFAKPIALLNGNYCVVYRPTNTASMITYSYVLNYIFCNSSNLILNTAQGKTLFSASMGNLYVPALFETANALNIAFTPLPGLTNTNTLYPNISNQVSWIKLNMSTYAVIPSTGVLTTVANTSAQSVSGYARAGSTPSGASFLATTSAVLSATSTQSTTSATLVVGQSTISTDTTYYGYDTACLADGTSLVLYVTATGTALKLAVISPTGALISTTTLATDAYNSATTQNSIRVTALSDGKIVCSYVQASSLTTLTMLILSSAYSILTTVTQATFTVSYAAGCNIAALTNARFVMSFTSTAGGNPRVAVWDSSGTSLLAATGPASASTSSPAVTGIRSGFYLSWTDGINGGYAIIYNEVTTNSWSGNQFTLFSANQNIYGRKALTGPSGLIYDSGPLNTNTGLRIITQAPMFDANSSLVYTYANAANGAVVCATSPITPQAINGYGDSVVVSWGSSSQLGYFYNTAGYGLQGNPVRQTITGLSLGSAAGTYGISACGLSGHNVLVVTQNNSGLLTYLIFNPNAFVYSTSVVGGTTPSSTVPLSAARGVALLGVSTTAAPANGSGTVQINGSAQLNSSYSATTTGQSFDFKNPVTFGAAGVVAGRNVTLIGNV